MRFILFSVAAFHSNRAQNRSRNVNFYPFHIGDYQSHTSFLTPIEDISYRRCLDHYYLHESPLPDDIDELLRMLRLNDAAALQYVLNKFFTLQDGCWVNKRADRELEAYLMKSKKASESAKMRWHSEGNANAMRTHSEGNATNTNTNTKTITKFIKPSVDDVREYAKEIGFYVNPDHFIDYYEARGWKMSGNQPVKDWKACLRTWKRNQKTSSSDVTVPEVII